MSLEMSSTFSNNRSTKIISRDHAEKKLRFETEARARDMWCRFKSQNMVARSRGQHIPASEDFVVCRERLQELLGVLEELRDEPWAKVRDQVDTAWKALEVEFQRVRESVEAWSPPSSQ